jgi:hypothetical protein
MKEIMLTQGKVALVDDADWPLVAGRKWYANSIGRVTYASTHIAGRPIHMHRLIMETPPGIVTDHRNGDGLDNRRINLRLCTTSQNLSNRRKRSCQTSRYKGVHCVLGCASWVSQITVAREVHYLGSFSSEVEAALAYDRAAIEAFGEFALTNAMMGLLQLA